MILSIITNHAHELKVIFLVISTVSSVLTARHMVNVHGNNAPQEKWHEYGLNFLGIFLGWIAAYYFIFYRLGSAVEITDLVIILIAYIGITGYLPHIIINKGFKP